MSDTIKFGNMDIKQQEFVNTLLDTVIETSEGKGYVAPENLDLDGNGTVEFYEAAEYATTSPNWRQFANALDNVGLRHPYDERIIAELQSYPQLAGIRIDGKAPDLSGIDFLGNQAIEAGVASGSAWPFQHLSAIAGQMTLEDGIDMGIEAIRKWPDNPYVMLPLLNLSMTGSEENAKRIAGILAAEFPNTGRSETILASFATLDPACAEEAADYAGRALMWDKDNPFAASILSMDAIRVGKYKLAEDLIVQAYSIAPELPGRDVAIGHLNLARGRIDEAFSLFIHRDLNPAEGLTLAGIALCRGIPSLGIELAAATIKLLPDESNPMYVFSERNLGLAYATASSGYLLMGDMKEARKAISEALATRPDDIGVRATAAMIAGAEMDIASAREYLEPLMRDKNSIAALQHMMMFNLQSGDFAALEKDGRSLIEKLEGEDTFVTIFTGGLMAMVKGNYEEARRLMLASHFINPHDFASELNLVTMGICDDKIGSATIRLRSLGDRYPEIFEIKAQAPLLDLRKGKYAKAARNSARLLERYPNHMNLLVINAMARVMMAGKGDSNELEAALEIGNRLASSLPNWHFGKRIQARALLKMGKLDEARAAALEAQRLETFDMKQWPLMSSSALIAEIDAARTGK